MEVDMDIHDFWYPAELKSMGAPPTGSRAGQLLFLSAQFPRDLESGRVIHKFWDLPPSLVQKLETSEHRDGREGPIKAQTWTVYTNIAQILEANGTSLDNVVKQGIYLRDPEDVGPMEEMMLTFFPGQKPATNISCTSTRGMHRDYLIQVEVVAFVPGAGRLQKQVIDLPDLAPVTSPYPQAMRVGQLVFFSALPGINPATGRPGRAFDDVDPETRPLLVTGRGHTDGSEEVIKTQVTLIHQHLKRILESQGGSMADLVKLRHYAPVGPRHSGKTYPLRIRFMGTPKDETPCLTGYYVPHLTGAPGLDIKYDGVALLPGEWKKGGEVWPEIDMMHLPMTQRAGPYIFTTGYVAMDKLGTHGPLESFTQLKDAGRLFGLTRFDDNEPLQAQTWLSYHDIKAMVERAGSDMSRVVYQSVLVREAAQYPVVEQIASYFYGGRIPPTTITEVNNIGPYDGLLLEVWVIAIRNDG